MSASLQGNIGLKASQRPRCKCHARPRLGAFLFLFNGHSALAQSGHKSVRS